MTAAELMTSLGTVSTQLTDLVQTIVEKMLGVNHQVITIEAAGTTPVVFTLPYSAGIPYYFTFKKATNSEGFDIGFTIPENSITVNGFDVIVTEPCTFEFITISFNEWITD
jgi:hypothetical protein